MDRECPLFSTYSTSMGLGGMLFEHPIQCARFLEVQRNYLMHITPAHFEQVIEVSMDSCGLGVVQFIDITLGIGDILGKSSGISGILLLILFLSIGR